MVFGWAGISTSSVRSVTSMNTCAAAWRAGLPESWLNRRDRRVVAREQEPLGVRVDSVEAAGPATGERLADGGLFRPDGGRTFAVQDEIDVELACSRSKRRGV